MKSQVQATEMASARSRALDFLELTKARIGVFVVASTAVGFVLGSDGTPDALRLVHTLLATFLVSGGAAALNQYIERDWDGQMTRTADRPLPSGRLAPEQALLCGVLMLIVGLVYMSGWVNGLTAALGAATSATYLFLYTPLKRRTRHNTAVGAVAGALPPVGGWAAACGHLGFEAWVLFSIVFIWQFPHFFSIAWIYREDYGRGGYRMVSVGEGGESRTTRQTVFYSLLLLPLSLSPSVFGLSGRAYFVVAFLLSTALIGFSLKFARVRREGGARRLMTATLAYLPLLWVVMLIDRTP
jgi:protoheme IX farnesyltransferase